MLTFQRKDKPGRDAAKNAVNLDDILFENLLALNFCNTLYFYNCFVYYQFISRFINKSDLSANTDLFFHTMRC